MTADSGPIKHGRHAGSRPEPLTSDEFGAWFDTLMGAGGREMRSWPATYRNFSVKWFDAAGLEHSPANFAELQYAYDAELTSRIRFDVHGGEHPAVEATYLPGGAKPRAQVDVHGVPAEVDGIVESSARLFPDPLSRPLLFISWGGHHSMGIAGALKVILDTRVHESEVFLSSESIEVGSDPMKAMLEDGVLKANVLVVILTKESASNIWTVWETAAAWAKGAKVIPLFIDVAPSEVGGPLTTRVQGAMLADRSKVDQALQVITRELCEAEATPMSDEEFDLLLEAAESASHQAGPTDSEVLTVDTRTHDQVEADLESRLHDVLAAAARRDKPWRVFWRGKNTIEVRNEGDLTAVDFAVEGDSGLHPGSISIVDGVVKPGESVDIDIIRTLGSGKKFTVHWRWQGEPINSQPREWAIDLG